jgi:hypothetical protein
LNCPAAFTSGDPQPCARIADINNTDRRKFLSRAAGIAGGLLAVCGGGSDSPTPAPPPPAPPPPPPASRSFRLGVTRWPPDLTLDAVAMVDQFVARDCDFVAPMLLGGVPWPEASAGTPFSAHLNAELAYRKSVDHRMLVSLGALDATRKAMAPYWGSTDNLPRPAPWDALALDSTEVKTAFTHYARRVVEAMQPDYLAIGIESNVLLTSTPALWPALKALHRHTFSELKRRFPQLPVCFTIEALHLLGLADGSDATAQRREVREVLAHSDLVAFSVYPHVSFAVPRPLPDGFFDFARDLALAVGNKPIAVSESGYTSRDTQVFNLTLRGTESDQRRHVELLLAAARRDRYAFVVNFASTDFEKLTAKLTGDAQQLANIWTWTGLQRSDGSAKPALEARRQSLALPLV